MSYEGGRLVKCKLTRESLMRQSQWTECVFNGLEIPCTTSVFYAWSLIELVEVSLLLPSRIRGLQ